MIGASISHSNSYRLLLALLLCANIFWAIDMYTMSRALAAEHPELSFVTSLRYLVIPFYFMLSAVSNLLLLTKSELLDIKPIRQVIYGVGVFGSIFAFGCVILSPFFVFVAIFAENSSKMFTEAVKPAFGVCITLLNFQTLYKFRKDLRHA